MEPALESQMYWYLIKFGVTQNCHTSIMILYLCEWIDDFNIIKFLNNIVNVTVLAETLNLAISMIVILSSLL